MLELSADAGLVAAVVLTFQIVLGLLLGIRYNPWKRWPHRRINYYKIHNWTGYIAITFCLLHPMLLLASDEAKFRIVDVLYPLGAPKQPVINTLGALALYVLLVVIVTSYYRAAIGHDRWKIIHYATYAAAGLFFVHGIWSDPSLKDKPIDYIDAEKLWLEICFVLVIVGSILRARFARRHRRFADRAVERRAA